MRTVRATTLVGTEIQLDAVEPHPGMRAVLVTRCPQGQIVDGTLMAAVLPTQVDVGLISHMLCHVPAHTWGASTMYAAQHLIAPGTLIVTLKAVCSAMWCMPRTRAQEDRLLLPLHRRSWRVRAAPARVSSTNARTGGYGGPVRRRLPCLPVVCRWGVPSNPRTPPVESLPGHS